MSTAELTPELASEAIEQGASDEVLVTNPNFEDENLINFLRKELLINEESIAIALRYAQQDRGPLPMILWRYGFVSLHQLNQIFDWMAQG